MTCRSRTPWIAGSGAHSLDGLAELFLLGRLDLTVEHHVLLPEYKPLFSEDERRTARMRNAALQLIWAENVDPAGKSDPGDALAIARVALREEGLGPIPMPGITEDLKLLVDARDQR